MSSYKTPLFTNTAQSHSPLSTTTQSHTKSRSTQLPNSFTHTTTYHYQSVNDNGIKHSKEKATAMNKNSNTTTYTNASRTNLSDKWDVYHTKQDTHTKKILQHTHTKETDSELQKWFKHMQTQQPPASFLLGNDPRQQYSTFETDTFSKKSKKQIL